ncbi:polysaccharide lyase family 1 protein [Aaosphaeria arxii CBS 175.79]|uniref:pectin lyase n=1 Tax=Aaosphaeria arxii CBS 175.79 TaxID=1450172 RepID=A0A6A5XZF0_9PLEO|nr:polysaccharide lyase family 1 protein [Aaosphaeria arxii CBS 175.79]KAF2018283.1 polysaccharide lyase family 1 protein [Aaosphaeria arxii CBS 175.79]
MKSSFATLILAGVPVAFAQVKNAAFGFAAGTTGGGTATPVYPTTTAQLVSYLTDSSPRVIMLDRTFDFLQTEGSTTAQCCSDNRTTKCPGGTSAGQLWIGDTCDSGTWQTCTYWNAPRKPIDVKSNKSIVGVGSKGVIRGKGLRFSGGVSNIIVQNIHFTELNPQFVWGGDALTLDNTDRIWIDHNKISLVGRQMIVSGWGKAGRVTISDNEFDGRTTWSAGCNGKHYWAALLIGKEDYITLAGNYLHDLSGRAPHLGTDNAASVVHAVNNYFKNIGGHAFDIEKNTWALLEGNYFENVDTTLTPNTYTSGGQTYFIQTVADASNAQSALGYIPEWNRLAGTSKAMNPITSSQTLSKFSQYKSQITWSHWKVENVPTNVLNNAGVGKV